METVSPICTVFLGCVRLEALDGYSGHYIVPAAVEVAVFCAAAATLPGYCRMGVSVLECVLKCVSVC